MCGCTFGKGWVIGAVCTFWYECPLVVFSLRELTCMYCVSGAVITQGFVWKFLYALYINFHSFITPWDRYFFLFRTDHAKGLVRFLFRSDLADGLVLLFSVQVRSCRWTGFVVFCSGLISPMDCCCCCFLFRSDLAGGLVLLLFSVQV